MIPTLQLGGMGRRGQLSGGAWTPASLLVPPHLWLDENSSVTDAGAGACSQWNDRSGNAYHFVQATGANRPLIVAAGLNGKRTIRFDGTSQRMTTAVAGSGSIYRNTGAGWAFAVYKKTGTDGGATSRTLFTATNGSDGSSRFVVNAGVNANTPALFARRLDGDATATLHAASASGTAFHMLMWRMDWANGDGFIDVDGANSSSNLALTSSGNTSDTSSVRVLMLGGYPGDVSGSAAVNLSDVEVGTVLSGSGSMPSAAEVDKLFGWAAHNWGLAANLPSGHPYKSAPP